MDDNKWFDRPLHEQLFTYEFNQGKIFMNCILMQDMGHWKKGKHVDAIIWEDLKSRMQIKESSEDQWISIQLKLVTGEIVSH